MMKKRKWLAVLLCLLLCLCVPAFAEEEVPEYLSACGRWYYVLLPDGTAKTTRYLGQTETGTPDEESDEVIVPAELDGHAVSTVGANTFYGDYGADVVTLSEGITDIERWAIWGYASLERISFPASMREIDSGFFPDEDYGPMQMEVAEGNPLYTVENGLLIQRESKTLVRSVYCPGSVVVPEGILHIAPYAFAYCFTEEIVLPQSLLTIGENAFCHNSFGEIVLPPQLQSIGPDAFSYCANLKQIIFPASICYVGENAFEDCFVLHDVVFSEGACGFEDGVFRDCNFLSVHIPASMDLSKYNPFIGCGLLKQITLADDHPTMQVRDNVLFDKSGRTLLYYPEGLDAKGYAVPEGVTAIGRYAFYKCAAERVVVSNGVQCIGPYSFSESRILSVELPPSVTCIDECAYEACPVLKAAHLPAGITRIEAGAFLSCYELAFLTLPENLMFLGQSAFSNTDIASVTIPEGVRDIPKSCFDFCRKLEKVVLPENLQTIGDKAFRFCALKRVVLPESVASIGESCFDGCETLEEVVFSPALREIGPYAFNNTAITSALLPEGLEAVPIGCFRYCEQLTEVTLPSTLTSIGGDAFYGCDRLEEISFPAGLTHIASYAFSDCKKLKTALLPDGLLFLGEGAFEHTSFTEIFLPRSLETLGGNPVPRCKQLQAIHFDEDHPLLMLQDGIVMDRAGEKVYAVQPSFCLEEYAPPAGLKQIMPYGFYGAKTLRTVILPEGVEYIGPFAFYGCRSLLEVRLPESVHSMYDLVFSDNDADGSIELITVEELLQEDIFPPQESGEAQQMYIAVVPGSWAEEWAYANLWTQGTFDDDYFDERDEYEESQEYEGYSEE